MNGKSDIRTMSMLPLTMLEKARHHGRVDHLMNGLCYLLISEPFGTNIMTFMTRVERVSRSIIHVQ